MSGRRRLGIFCVMAGRGAGGPETYETEIVRRIGDLDRQSDLHLYCLSAAAAKALPTGRSEGVEHHVLRPAFRPAAMSLTLPWRLHRDRIDLLHAAYIPPPWTRVPLVFTLHCSSPFVRPELFPPAIRARLLALIGLGMRQARRVVCVSEDVRRHALKHYDVPEQRLVVVHNGVGDHFTPTPEDMLAPALARYGIRRPYVLAVGRAEPRKNLERVIAAAARVRRRMPDLSLVLAGAPSWAERGLQAALAAEGGSHGKWVGYVPNREMPLLYGGAAVFLFPSLWEGFGIPVLEAMACGTPVITSDGSSLPEVAGDAALLVDPTDTEAIAQALDRVLSDPALAATLHERGRRQAARFSWQRTAVETLAVYEQALGTTA
ncbi:MAG: glycosyltransferase family 1 protein [Geminicoccaceae bacterium]